MDPYIIATERLGLRRWLESDIEPFSKMNNDDDVMKYFPGKLNITETIALVEKINLDFNKNHFGLFAVENKLTTEFIGFTGFAIPTFDSFFTPCVEIGWRYKKEVWGQGFATEAAIACLVYGFNSLQFDEIVSFTSSINVQSEKVMGRIGMTHVTDFDHPKIENGNILCRHVLYQITKAEFDASRKKI
jgi:[ribosomal protein S5]-alanine N-acetyltransferase